MHIIGTRMRNHEHACISSRIKVLAAFDRWRCGSLSGMGALGTALALSILVVGLAAGSNGLCDEGCQGQGSF